MVCAAHGAFATHQAECRVTALLPRGSRQLHARICHLAVMRLAVLLSLLAACATTTAPSQVVVLSPASPPAWQTVHDVVDGCARSTGIAGEVRVRIEFDDRGSVRAVDSEYGDSFAGCIGNALLAAHYHAARESALLFVVAR